MSTLHEQIKEKNNKAHKEQMWAKPANDIISGIEYNDKVPPVRAIWELIQNARDVSREGGCDIVFERYDSKFKFSHNGLPFEIENLQALNIQTSSKVRNSPDQVGQYGTGFLTTHLFGLKFLLSSALLYILNSDINNKEKHFYYFKDLLFDRSTNDKTQMIDNLQNQNDKINSIYIDNDEISEEIFTTTFTYLQESEISKNNVEEALECASSSIPYVIALNKNINSISFIDHIKTTKTSFGRQNEGLIESNDLWDLHCIDIKKEETINSSFSEELLKIYVLQSRELDEMDNPVISIILPLKFADANTVKTFEFDKKVAKLFLRLPLVGSEEWGVNYIFNSSHFTCENEGRNSIRLVGNGMNNDDIAQANRNLVAKGQQIVFDFLDNTHIQFSDKKHLAYIDFRLNNANEGLNSYFKKIKDEWISYFKTKPLFETNKGDWGDVSTARFLSQGLLNGCFNHPSLLDAVYPIISSMINGNEHIPIKEEFIFWSKIVSRWFLEENSSLFLTDEEIAKHLHNLPSHNLIDYGIQNILDFALYVKENNANLFDCYAIIPNEQGIGFLQSALKDPDDFSDCIRHFAKGFIPSSVNSWVHPDFREIINFEKFGVKELKEAISNKTSEYLDKFIDASRKSVNNITVADWNQIYLGTELSNIILDYLNLFVQDSSDSFFSRTLRILTEFYGYKSTSSSNISKEFEWRHLLRLLINDTFAQFCGLNKEQQIEKEKFIHALVAELYTYKDFSDLLRYYPIYKNQVKDFVYFNSIKKEDEIPEQLKNYYDVIICDNENNLEGIRSKIIDQEYSDILIDGTFLKGTELAAEISQKLQLNPYPNISDSEYKSIIVEIITNHCEDKNLGSLWKRLFDKIYADKAMLLLSIIESPSKKESLSRLMTIDDDEKLKDVVSLLDSDDFSEIVRLGKEALSAKIRNENDTRYKKMLGSYVEDWITQQLEDELSENNLLCMSTVDNEQGGQDLIIYLNDEPIYYIEIKSRWNNRDSVMMSKLQMEVSADNKDKYALCAVDMTNFDPKKAETHVYPDISETLTRIKVSKRIGNDNLNIRNGLVTDEKLVHLGGDYKSVVPQSYLNEVGISFQSFVDSIIELIRGKLQNAK